MSVLVEFLRPATDTAVSKAIHDLDPEEFHKRLPPGSCPLCPSFTQQFQELLRPFQESLDIGSLSERLKDHSTRLAEGVEGDGNI